MGPARARQSAMQSIRQVVACLLGWLVATAAFAVEPAAPSSPQTVRIEVDAKAAGTAFPHFWEQMFGSGHAVLALRADYRHDLDMVKQATGFTYVRAHGILDGEVGVFELGKDGKPVYNFS